MTAIVWIYDAKARSMRAARKFHARCDREFCDQERYVMEPVDAAQSARDKAYHATMRDLWASLPKGLTERFPNSRDFRRHCLIECNFCDVDRLAFASGKEALQAVPLLARDGSQVGVRGAAVVVKTAWSQSLRGGMKKHVILESYEETQSFAASLVGTTVLSAERIAQETA